MRVLITGSRTWRDEDTVRQRLEEATEGIDPSKVTVVHGGANGADRIAGRIAESLGMRVEVHPADWGTLGKSAGPIRNHRTVRLGADVCLAFPNDDSVGTWDCVRKAHAAGIKVVMST